MTDPKSNSADRARFRADRLTRQASENGTPDVDKTLTVRVNISAKSILSL